MSIKNQSRITEFLSRVLVSRGALVAGMLLVLSAGIAVAASNTEVSACINNKTGTVRVLNFTGGQCTKGETALSWNIVGPKGDVGEQGPKGDSAQMGAGNIAFCNNAYPSCLKVLRTDGTVWDAGANNWVLSPQSPNFVPIPTSDIIAWEQYSFLDKNGDVWNWTGNNVWVNLGHP